MSRDGLLLEDVEDHHRVLVEAVDDPPRSALVGYAQLETARSDDRHGSRMRHSEALALLEPAEQEACLQTG
jgi:hypothetical protein